MKTKNIFEKILLFLVIISSVFCVSPLFIKMNIVANPLNIILLFTLSIPMFYIFSQCLHTILLFITSVFYKANPIYVYILLVIKLYSRMYRGIFFNQLMGFSPGLVVYDKETRISKNFFILYYFLYFITLIVYYVMFTFIYPNVSLLPLIPFSIIIALIQGLYKAENQQLFLLKSKVLTILNSRKDCHFKVDNYQAIWKLKAQSELPFIALSYVSLIKDYIPLEEYKRIELLEDIRFNNMNQQRAFYGMLDVIKLNLYLRKYSQKTRYEVLLDKMLGDKSHFFLLKQNIEASLDGTSPLSLSLAISELQFLVEVYSLK